MLKVGTSANSALIRYYLPRLKLSSSTRVSEGTNSVIKANNAHFSEITIPENFFWYKLYIAYNAMMFFLKSRVDFVFRLAT